MTGEPATTMPTPVRHRAGAAAPGSATAQLGRQSGTLSHVEPQQIGLGSPFEGLLVTGSGPAHIGLSLRLIHKQGRNAVPRDSDDDLDGSGKDLIPDRNLPHDLGINIGGDHDAPVRQAPRGGLG